MLGLGSLPRSSYTGQTILDGRYRREYEKPLFRLHVFTRCTELSLRNSYHTDVVPNSVTGSLSRVHLTHFNVG